MIYDQRQAHTSKIPFVMRQNIKTTTKLKALPMAPMANCVQNEDIAIKLYRQIVEITHVLSWIVKKMSGVSCLAHSIDRGFCF